MIKKIFNPKTFSFNQITQEFLLIKLIALLHKFIQEVAHFKKVISLTRIYTHQLICL